MAYVLQLHGNATNLSTARVMAGVAIRQVALRDRPQDIAESLNRYAADPSQRDLLDTWPLRSIADADYSPPLDG